MNDLIRDYARWNRVERVGLAIVAALGAVVVVAMVIF
jgi:hypothetical protein